MKREDLPLVTPAQFKRFKPCWLETEEGRTRFERIAAAKDEWSALDVLDLEDVSARDKFWSVLRKAFLPSMLHDGFQECMRVLKPDGVLIFKWSEYDIPAADVWKAIGEKPLFGHHSGKKSNTFWACFMKLDER